MNNPYDKPAADVSPVATGSPVDAEKIESRRKIMMTTFFIVIAGVVMALVLMGLIGGETGAMVGGLLYMAVAIVGLVNFVFMLMLTSTLHGGGWVAANLVGSLIIPLYSLVALLMLNSQAKKRLAAAA